MHHKPRLARISHVSPTEKGGGQMLKKIYPRLHGEHAVLGHAQCSSPDRLSVGQIVVLVRDELVVEFSDKVVAR
jgi:hypothetical protein